MITILIIVALVLVIIFSVWWIILACREKLPDGTKLVQSKSFYKKHKDATVKYLSAVYPTAKNTFEKMSAVDLAIFYNSLWYYYNCEAAYDKDFYDYYTTNKYGYIDPNAKIVKHCWQELPGCGTDWPKLPYTPQGYLYSFKNWVEYNWQPFIYSDSTIPPSKISAAALCTLVPR